MKPTIYSAINRGEVVKTTKIEYHREQARSQLDCFSKDSLFARVVKKANDLGLESQQIIQHEHYFDQQSGYWIVEFHHQHKDIPRLERRLWELRKNEEAGAIEEVEAELKKIRS